MKIEVVHRIEVSDEVVALLRQLLAVRPVNPWLAEPKSPRAWENAAPPVAPAPKPGPSVAPGCADDLAAVIERIQPEPVRDPAPVAAKAPEPAIVAPPAPVAAPVPVQVPAPVVVTTPARKSTPNSEAFEKTWTDGRVALLRREWPAGWPASDILIALNALPGPAVSSADAVTVKASKLNLARAATPDPSKLSPATVARWTEARTARLKQLYAEGVAVETILSRLNALPGAPINSQSMLAKVAVYGLQRPTVQNTDPIDADFETIRATVAPKGMRLETLADLPAINERLIALGHRPFRHKRQERAA